MSTTPYLAGSNATSATSVTLTVGTMGAGASGAAQGIAAGDTIVVVTSGNDSTIPTVTDSQGNLYVQQESSTSEFNSQVWVCESSNAPLVAGVDTITASYGTTFAHNILALGIADAAGLDITATPTSSPGSTAPSISSGTLSQAPEVAIAIVDSGNGGGTLTWGGSPLVSSVGLHSGTSSLTAVAAYSQASTTSASYGGTLASSTKWNMLLLTFKEGSSTGSVAGVYVAGSAGASSTTSLTVPVTQDTQDGDNLAIGVAVGTAPNIVSVTDSAGNSYTSCGSDSTEANAALYYFQCPGAAALAAGEDSLTVTFSTPTACAAILVGDTGVSQSGFDKVAIAHGSSAAPSVASGTLSQAEENCIVFLADTNAGGAPTWGGGFTPLANAVDGGSHVRLSAAAQQVTATTSVTASATITSAPWTAGILTDELPPPVQTTVLSVAIEGVAYSQALAASGGIGALTWTLTDGALPSGLTLASGVISGTPTVGGDFAITLTVTDAHGLSSSLAQTITVMPSGASVASLQPISTNILPNADSNFEVSGFTWAAQSNAQPPFLSSSSSLVGSQSLAWKASAAGSTSIATAKYPVEQNKPYIASGYLLTTSNQAPPLALGINWFDGTGTLLGTSVDTVSSNGPLMWQPVTLATAAPAGATQAEVFVEVQAANANDINLLDLVFLTQTDVQVLIDWVNPAFGQSSAAGNAFMDVSPWLRLDQNVNITRGRQDAISEITTGQSYFYLQNDGGWFTKNRTDSIAVALGGSVRLQLRGQVNFADELGIWHTRFDGQISEIDYQLDPTGYTNLATVYLSDILNALGREDSLECWTKEQVRFNGPTLHWSLEDQPNAGGWTIATESSGNGGPPLKMVRSDNSGSATIAWQDTTGGVETLANAAAAGQPDGSEYWPAGARIPTSVTRGLDSGAVGPSSTPLGSVYFTPKLTAQSAKNTYVGNTGYQLQAQLPFLIAPSSTPDGDFAVECWFTMDPGISTNGNQNYGPYTVISLGSSRRNSEVLVAGVFQAGLVPNFGIAAYKQPPGFAGANFPGSAPTATASAISPLPEADTVQRPHHLVINVQGDPTAPTATLYLDGNVWATINLSAGTVFDTICVGGAFGTTGCFWGGISLVSIYGFQLSQQQITQDCQMGQYGMWECPTDDCIAQLAQLAQIPSFWNNVNANHNGLTLTDYYDITGNNAYNAMTVYEQTENGLLYVNAAGQLNFYTRDFRQGHGGPDLFLPPDSFSEAMGLEIIDSFQINESAVASVAFPGGAGFVNEISQAEFGTYAQNPIGSPNTLAHISWSRAYEFYGLTSSTFWPDPSMDDYVAWQANVFSDPWLSPGGITVDLLTIDPNWGFNISNIYELEIGKMIAPSGSQPESFPNSTGSSEWFIEGITETKGVSQSTITFYGSPAETQRAWIPGDAVYGVLGQTTRIGVSAADTSTPQADGKDVSHDGGPPYWAPTFSADMNSPSGTGGFVGGVDFRGLTWPLEQMLQPPICALGTTSSTQSVPSGSLASPQIFWDTVYADSANGMGILPGWPNWYVCLVPGFYEIDANLVWGASTTNAGAAHQAWIVVAQEAAQAVANGSGTPATVTHYVCPVGESSRRNGVGFNVVNAPTVRLYLGLGDMVALAGEQDTGSAINTGTAFGGSSLSIRFVGLGTVDDRAEINSSINGGSVNNPVPVTHGTKTYFSTDTYSHYGSTANNSDGLRNHNGDCYQGVYQGGTNSVGSQFSLIRFPWQQIQSDLAGKTLTSVTLTCTNLHSWYSSGMGIMLGCYYTNSESSSPWKPSKQSPAPNWNIWSEYIAEGATKTFSLPAGQFQAQFVSKVAHGLTLGDNGTKDLYRYGYFKGGANWKLVVTF